MEIPKLIYCAGGNRRFAQIAIEAGFLFGSQMPQTVYYSPYFIDLDPNRLPKQPAYIARLRKHWPVMASVHDWSEDRRLGEILMRAEEIAQFTDNVLLIPKVPGGISKLPRTINNKQVILGYSVPTKHGKTDIDITEFTGWPVHLLGGSPQRQMELFKEFSQIAEVISVDGNMHQLMAVKHCAFFDPSKQTKQGYWPSIKLFDGKQWGDGSNKADAPYEAFRRSCKNIRKAWQNVNR